MIPRYTRPEMAKIWEEKNKFQKFLDIEILVCEALCKKGIVPEKSLQTIKKKAKFDVKRIEEIEKVTKHDVIAFLTNVAENVGEDSRFIHMGLTSSDILDTGLSLQLKEAAEIIIKDIKEVMKAIKKLALRYKRTVMAGRSHGMHAEPITFGFKMAVWYDEMKRNLKRVKQAKETISYGKISGAVGTFANISPDVEKYVCKKLGLKNAPASTQILQRDRHAEFLNALAITAASLEKFAVEIRHLQRTEVGEAEEFFSKGQKGSSAMPHKRNPITCERISGLARILRANAMAAMENIALWHERDISHSSVERVIMPDSTILIDYMLDKMANLLTNLNVKPERMKKNLEMNGGIIFSQAVLLKLIDKGVIREKAYEIVQRNAMKAIKESGSFKDCLFEDKELAKYLSKSEIERVFDYKYHTKNIDKVFRRVFR
ncbi:MAG: adenylosuccinate lyase [Candidatus Schekmanbacteria bacterium]|nr:MAG: adenylosuccinate lyase [Candidatus Schekmanbacteria bacterium]